MQAKIEIRKEKTNITLRTASASNSDTVQSFYHENFRRGRIDLLGLVTRRGASKGEKDVKAMQLEIVALKRREQEQRERMRELEENNRQLMYENNALMEENKLLKANWARIRDSLGRGKSMQQGGNPHYTQIGGGGDPSMFATYPDHSSTLYRPVQLQLFTPVTQNMPSIDPSNPNSLMQHLIMDDDFHRSGGPFGTAGDT